MTPELQKMVEAMAAEIASQIEPVVPGAYDLEAVARAGLKALELAIRHETYEAAWRSVYPHTLEEGYADAVDLVDLGFGYVIDEVLKEPEG